MNRASTIVGLLVVCLSPVNAATQEPNEHPNSLTIPLKEIWAFKMPGTRDLEDLAREHAQKSTEDLWTPIIESLSEISLHWPRQGQMARQGFAIEGEGIDALRGVYAVLAMDKEPRKTFDDRSDISIVFFSYQLGSYVQVRNVKRLGNLIRVQYRLVGHTEKHITSHIALIPLGKLPVGKYRIEISQTPSAPVSSALAAIGRRFVSGSFTFEVATDSKDR